MRRGALLRAASASVCLLCLAGMGAQAMPENSGEGVYSIGIPAASAEDGGDVPLAPSPSPQPAEVQAVWDLGAGGNWGGAEENLRVLRERHALWQASPELMAYVTSGHRDQQLGEALAGGDWGRALSLLPQAPAGACEAPFHLRARAQALEGAGEAGPLQAFYEAALANCSDAGLVAELAGRAATVLEADGLSRLASIPQFSRRTEPELVQARAMLQLAATRLRFQQAEAGGDLQAVSLLAETSGDAGLLAQAGWLRLDSDAGRAARHFRDALAQGGSEDARRGLILAELQAGNFAAARDAISDAPESGAFEELAARADLAEARALRSAGAGLQAAALADRAAARDAGLVEEAAAISGGALLDAAGTAYDAGDFAAARDLASRAASYPAVRRAAGLRLAWAELQSGDAALAAASFSRLYVEQPDMEAAEGYALAAQKSGSLASAAALARAVGGPLGEKVQAQYASAAFYGGDYLTAHALAPDTYDALEGIDRTLYRQSFALRQQDGTRGQNKLEGFASTSSVEMIRDTSRYEAGLTVYRLDTGAPDGAGRETFAAPYLGWSREGATSLAARIGLLPAGGGADPALTGELAAVSSFGAHSVEVRAFVRPKTESLLAFAGEALEAGQESGRVSEAGMMVRGRFDAGGGRALQADAAVSTLEGQDTLDNTMVSAGVSASQAIAKDGFDYLVTGPFYQFQSYDRNTNFFTPGHGGYFSPQQFHRAGWSVNARTEPLKDWIVKADAALAYETVREDSAREFPLRADQGALIGGGRSTGVAGALDIALARRLGPEVILSANLSVTASKAFEDLRAGIGFVWVPGGRAALVPSDLATDPFSPASWIRP